ncbi:hypothetical protein BDFB_011479, partial [Asbolus verrucosus]
IRNKLRYFYLTCITIIAVNFIHCLDSGEVLEKVKSKHIRKYLEAKKDTVDSGLSELDEICPGVSEKLEDAVINFLECADKVDDSLTICEAIQSATLNCTQPLIKLVDDCLPAKAKGLPSLGINSFRSVSEYLCKQSGESLFELLNPCLWEDAEDSSATAQCERDLETRMDKFVNGTSLPSTTEVCSFATSVRNCLKLDGEKSCKNQKTREVALGLVDAIVAPCSAINEVDS